MALLNASSAPITHFTGEVAGEAEEVTAPGGDDCGLILPKGNGPGSLYRRKGRGRCHGGGHQFRSASVWPGVLASALCLWLLVTYSFPYRLLGSM